MYMLHGHVIFIFIHVVPKKGIIYVLVQTFG